MKRKYNRTLGVIVAMTMVVVIFTGGSMISAAPESIYQASNKTATGGVDISIQENDAPNFRKLIPERYESNITTINNDGDKCWVRLKCNRSVKDLENSTWQINEQDANIENTSWFLAPDGYFYSTTPLDVDATIQFEELVSVPVLEQVSSNNGFVWTPVYGERDSEKWNIPSPDPNDDEDVMTYYEPAGGLITSSVVVEAVQFDNFNPDFSAPSPWGDVEIEDTIYHRVGGTND